MTNRQRAMGIDQQTISRLRETGEYCISMDAFCAAASELKKGAYSADEVARTMAAKYTPWIGWRIELMTADDNFKNNLRGLAARHPDHYNYRNTHDLDRLVVK